MYPAAVAQGHVYVARTQRDGALIGTLRLTWMEPALWPHDPGGAGYVHGIDTMLLSFPFVDFR